MKTAVHKLKAEAEGCMKKMRFVLAVAVSVVFGAVVFASSGSAKEEGVSAEKAWERLMKGNKRFTSGKMIHEKTGKKWRQEIAKAQKPLAVVVTCSDSRLAPELIFDRGLGEIFVVRTAGNVVDPIAIGSIEYALEHLGAKLVVVLGHERCGAVKATVDGGKFSPNITAIAKKIEPSMKKAKKEQGDLVDNTVRENVKSVVQELEVSKPVIGKMIKDEDVEVIGAYYDLDSGKVSKIDEE
jgi:carbonic anhydrase